MHVAFDLYFQDMSNKSLIILPEWPEFFLLLIYLESIFRNENFLVLLGSVRPSVKNLEICRAVKRPKAMALDRPQGPEQCFITCLTIS